MQLSSDLEIKQAKISKVSSWIPERKARLEFEGQLNEGNLQIQMELSPFGDDLTAAGRITRGISCQERFDAYEELVQESETAVAEFMADVEEEQAAREQAQAVEQENAWVFGDAAMIPSLDGFGLGIATGVTGQEHLRYGPPAGDFQSRTFGF